MKLTEYHHIIEFADGGSHNVGNLILLCPTCHSEFHSPNNNINEAELITRKSFHKDGDRIAGNMQFFASENKVKCGGLFLVNHTSLITFGKMDVLSLVKIGDKFMIDCRFYDATGNLIMWMSRNRYWVVDSFSIKTDKTSFEISSPNYPDNKITIRQVDDYFLMDFKNYHKGSTIEFGTEGLKIGGELIDFSVVGNGTIDANKKGIISL